MTFCSLGSPPVSKHLASSANQQSLRTYSNRSLSKTQEFIGHWKIVYLLLLRLSRPSVPSTSDTSSPLKSAHHLFLQSPPLSDMQAAFSAARRNLDHRVSRSRVTTAFSHSLHLQLGSVQHQLFNRQNDAPGMNAGALREAEGELPFTKV